MELGAFLLLLCLTACNKHASPTHGSLFSHAEIIGSQGAGAGQFNKPRSLAVDSNDNIYVVDLTGRVQKFSPDGKFLLSWQMPQTDLGKPKGMCRDSAGNIIIVEPHYQRVNHFTPDGQLVAQWGTRGTNAGELTLPRAVAIDTKGRVIVSEYTLVDRVQKFAPRGERVLTSWGTPGQAHGQFNRAEGVATDSADRVYVADSCNHRVQVFSPEGQFLRAFGKPGRGAGEMSYPYDVQVDAEGRVYVCEFGNSRIQVFDGEGRSVEIIGQAGSAPGEFNNPWSIALDSKGNLLVADSQNHRVQKLIRARARSSKHQGPSSRETPSFKSQTPTEAVAVAQTSGLPYRRLAAVCRSDGSVDSERIEAPQVADLRYGRPEVCATSGAARSDALELGTWSFFGAWSSALGASSQ